MIAGIHDSVASRIAAMARRVGLAKPVMMTGGVAQNQGVVRSLESRLELEIRVSEHAQLNGAIGAAILAARSI
jgi:activator of 2-hydroxyglutaryl-CoA dehydratase